MKTKSDTPVVQRLLSGLADAHFSAIEAEMERESEEMALLDDAELPQRWVDEWWLTFVAKNKAVH